MDKEEVLKRSRLEEQDEGITHAMRFGAISGFLGMSFIYFAFWLVIFLIDETQLKHLDSMDILFQFGWGIEMLSFGIKARKKLPVVVGVLFLILGVLQTITFFMRILG